VEPSGAQVTRAAPAPLELEHAAERWWRDLADWREHFEERAAIGEYERGMSRAEAEEAARVLAGPPPTRP
jgi:hypothetical protein